MQPAPEPSILFYAFAGVIFSLGLFLLILGLRGKRIDDHPFCRKCKFNLTGRNEQSNNDCPECGNDLTKPKAVRIGQREKRRGLIGVALFVMLFGITAIGVKGYADATNVNWQHHKPVWLLMREANGVQGIISDQAIDELIRREAAGLLDQDDESAFIDLLLTNQADRSHNWRTEMGDVIEKRWVSGNLDRSLWGQYTAQFLVDTHVLEVRPKIVIGSDGVAIRMIDQDVRCGSGTHINYDIEIKSTKSTIGPVTLNQGYSSSSGSISHQNSGTSTSNHKLNDEQWSKIKPGKHEITKEVKITITQGNLPTSPSSSNIFASRIITYVAEAEFIAPGQSTAKLNTDSSIQAAVESAITLKRVRTRQYSFQKNTDNYDTSLHFEIKPRPVDAVFTIYLKDGDNEIEAGSVVMAAGRDTGLHTGSTIKDHDLRGKHIDVILRPDIHQAESSIDCFEIWGEEIVFKDVLVEPG